VIHAQHRSGVAPERVAAIAFVPELEVVFEGTWTRVLAELSQRRSMLPSKLPFWADDPKESFHRVLAEHRLRASPALFAELASVLPLSQLKTTGAIGRLATQLVAWFGSEN
jgi:hypothetical protein